MCPGGNTTVIPSPQFNTVFLSLPIFILSMARATFSERLVDDELVSIGNNSHLIIAASWSSGYKGRLRALCLQITIGTGDLPLTDSRTGTIHVGSDTDVRETYRICGQIFETLKSTPFISRCVRKKMHLFNIT